MDISFHEYIKSIESFIHKVGIQIEVVDKANRIRVIEKFLSLISTLFYFILFL